MPKRDRNEFWMPRKPLKKMKKRHYKKWLKQQAVIFKRKMDEHFLELLKQEPTIEEAQIEVDEQINEAIYRGLLNEEFDKEKSSEYITINWEGEI